MIEWPQTLPNHAMRNGYSVKPRSNVIAHDTQTGPGTRRRRQSSNIYDVPVPIYLESEAQRHEFIEFYEVTTQSGALPFIWMELDEYVGPRYYKYWFDAQNPYQITPMGVEFQAQLNLVAWPDAQPINLIEDGTLKLGTLSQSSITYYDANGNQQTAPADTAVVEYNPVDGTIRGLPLGADGQITVPISLAQQTGTLKYTEEPATVADRIVYALSDGTSGNRIALLVEGGRYVFRVTVGGADVADIDTGVECIPYKHQEIDASYAIDAFYAAASGGSIVSDTDGALPNITQWVIGDPGSHTIQCWILDYSYVPRALREFNPIQSYGPGYLELAGDGVKHPLVQVTRNTEATYFDANGVLQTAGIDEPVFEYRPESGELWLRKGQQETNEIPSTFGRLLESDYSANKEMFFQDVQAILPTGETGTATLAGWGGSRTRVQTGAADRSAKKYGVFIKFPDGAADTVLQLSSQGENIRINMRTLTPEQAPVNSWRLRPVAHGWAFLEWSGDAEAYSAINITRADGQFAENTSVMFWAMQQYVSDEFDIAPILSNNGATTRAADDIRVTDLTPFNGFAAGAFVIQYETQGRTESGGATWVLSRGSSGRFLNDRGDSAKASWDGGSDIANNIRNAADGYWAVAWGENEVTDAANGVVYPARDWNGSWGSGDLIIGERSWSGWIKLRFIPRRVSDAELQALTS